MGIDPLAEREAIRTAPTVNELADRFVAEHLSRRRASSVAHAEHLLKLYVRPELGKLEGVAEVEARRDRAAPPWDRPGHPHPASGRPAPIQANRCVALVSKMMALAMRWEMRPDNPVRGVEREPERRRARYLSPAELSRLGDALAAHPKRAHAAANCIRLLALTGARRGETLAAQWSEFDLKAGVWTKPSSHLKQKPSTAFRCRAPARALLLEMRRRLLTSRMRGGKKYNLPPVPHLFPSVDGRPLGDLKKSWAIVCRKAELVDVRLHDLRHSFKLRSWRAPA